MSEEILKALTQLFAIITKQDGGATEVERRFVTQFFQQELDQDSVKEYVALYEEFLGSGENKGGLTTVKDSVRTLGLCKKINKTLTQKQKVIVLIRLLELVSSDKNFTPQRMGIIDTVSTVFNIEQADYKIIEGFVLNNDSEALAGFSELLIVSSEMLVDYQQAKHIHSHDLEGEIVLLRVNSVDIYFVKYTGPEDILLNGLLMKPFQVYLFSNGSTIKTPKSLPLYYSDVISKFMSGMKDYRLSFLAHNIEFRFPNGGLGLRDVNILEGPCKLIGIMGGSGAGKTTLLNVLAGIEKPSKGEILINNLNIHVEKDQLQGVIGYVAQDDLLIEELTVYENLYYNAKLCFKDYSEAQLDKIVMEVLTSLGLEQTRNLRVGSVLEKTISGGQRKRLNIALELIREPVVMFVDEPTSGLSSRDSENVIDLLKELSLKGKLIFVVIHQPSSDIYKMFDKIFIMDVGGYPIYYGNPVEAVVYFKKATNQVDSERGQCSACGNVNPEQIFNIIEAKVVDEYGRFTNKRKVTSVQWNELYMKKGRLENVPLVNDTPPQTLSLPSRIKQTLIFSTRDLFSKISNTQYLIINLLEAPVLAVLLAFIIRYQNTPGSSEYTFRYNDNIPAYILVAVLVALFMGLTVSAEEIIRDRKILRREAFLNLSRTSYLSSKLIILFSLSAVQTLTFVLIGNWILEIHGMTLSYWAVLFSVSCFANILGLNISASFNSAVTVYIMIPLLLIPQMILSGVIFSFDKLNDNLSTKGKVPMVADLMASRWSFEALAVQQFKRNPYQIYYYDQEKTQSESYYKYTYLIPELLEKLETSVNRMSSKQDSIKALLVTDLAILRNEINAEPIQTGLTLKVNDALTSSNFTPAVANQVRTYLESLKQVYTKKFNEADVEKERRIAMLESKPEYHYNVTAYKNLYYNEALADLVKNATVKDRITEYEGRLYQQSDPIFHTPTLTSNPLDYRTHFLAPAKRMAGLSMDTFYFNILVIWFTTLFLYITLYFETFRRVFALFGKIDLSFAMTWFDIIKSKVVDLIKNWKAKKPVPVMGSTSE
jgi:ABC-type multidrug transport system ATPase subunit